MMASCLTKPLNCIRIQYMTANELPGLPSSDLKTLINELNGTFTLPFTAFREYEDF